MVVELDNITMAVERWQCLEPWDESPYGEDSRE